MSKPQDGRQSSDKSLALSETFDDQQETTIRDTPIASEGDSQDGIEALAGGELAIAAARAAISVRQLSALKKKFDHVCMHIIWCHGGVKGP